MPRKFPPLSGAETVAALERLGFVRGRPEREHIILKRTTAGGVVGCVVPDHGELALGTIRRILKQAKTTEEQFVDQL